MRQSILVRLNKVNLDSGLQYWLLAAITLTAVVLRFYKLGHWSFWIDELYTVGRVKAHYSNLEVIESNIPPSYKWTPLSLVLSGGAFNVFGANEWSARLVPALMGIISIPILYLPIKRLFGPAVALISALLLTVSPWHLYWSQNARFVTTLFLLYSLATFAFFFAFERDRLGYFFLFFFLLYLAASERLFALFLIPVVISYFLFLKILKFEKPLGLHWKNVILLIFPGIVIGIIDIYRLLSDGSPIFLNDIYVFWGNSIESPLAQAVFIAFEIGIPLMILAIFGGFYLLIKKSQAGLLFCLVSIIPYILLVTLTPFMFTEERYAFITLLGWIVLSANCIKEIFAQSKEYGKILAIGILLVPIADGMAGDLKYYYINNGNRRDFKSAFSLVSKRSNENDIFVSTWPKLGNYYLNKEVIDWQAIDPDAIVRGAKRVWFIIVPSMAWKNRNLNQWVSKNTNLINIWYLRRYDDARVMVYLYDPIQHGVVEK